MNLSGSECSSGCESGWTVYFDQLSNSTDPYSRAFVTDYIGKGAYVNEDQDEDLSMVSDASSGPPHFQDNCYSPSISQQKKKNKLKSKTKEPRPKKHQSLCNDDDTASSPIFHYSQDNVPIPDSHDPVEHVSGFSQVISPTHFQDGSIAKKHLGFFKSSKKGSPGCFLGRKRQ